MSRVCKMCNEQSNFGITLGQNFVETVAEKKNEFSELVLQYMHITT